MNFDEILDTVGGWGVYQKRIYFIFTFLFELFATQNVVFMMFGGASPEWHCDNDYDTNFAKNNSSDNCSIYRTCKTIVYHEDLQSVATEFHLYCDRSFVGDMITTVQMTGLSLGGLLWGQLAEILGRRKTLIIIYFLLFSAGLIAAFSVNWIMFVISYFFVGIGLGGSLTVEFTLLQEFLATEKRLFVTVMNGWPFGVFVFCGLSYFLKNWRYILIVSNAPPLFFLILFIWIYESPRWLLQHGRSEEAYEILCKVASTNGRPKPEMSKLKYLLCSQTTAKKKYSYHHLFSRRQLTRYTLAMMFSFLVVSCVSYGLIFNVKNLYGNRYLNAFIMACLGAVTQWSILFLNKWFGRRAIHQGSLLIGGIACLVVMVLELLDQGKNYIYFTSVFAAMGNAALNPTWNIVSLYTVELFPTVVRNLAGGLCSMASRAGGIFAPMLVYMCHSWKPLPFIVFGLLCIANFIVAFVWLPDTKGKPLSDALPPKPILKEKLSEEILITTDNSSCDLNNFDISDREVHDCSL